MPDSDPVPAPTHATATDELERRIDRWRLVTVLSLAIALSSLALSVWSHRRRPEELRFTSDKLETTVNAEGVVTRTRDGKFAATLDGRGLAVIVKDYGTLDLTAMDGLRYKRGDTEIRTTLMGLVAAKGDDMMFLEPTKIGLKSKTGMVTLDPHSFAMNSLRDGPQFRVTLADRDDLRFASLSLGSSDKLDSQVSIRANRSSTSAVLTSPREERRTVGLWAGGSAQLSASDGARDERVELRTGGEDEIDEPRLTVTRGTTRRTISAPIR